MISRLSLFIGSFVFVLSVAAPQSWGGPTAQDELPATSGTYVSGDSRGWTDYTDPNVAQYYNPASAYRDLYEGTPGYPGGDLLTNRGYLTRYRERLAYPTNDRRTSESELFRQGGASADPAICLWCLGNNPTTGMDVANSLAQNSTGILGTVAGLVLGFQQNKISERIAKDQGKAAKARAKAERENYKDYKSVMENMGFPPQPPNSYGGEFGSRMCGGAPYSCSGAIGQDLALALSPYGLPGANINAGCLDACAVPANSIAGPDYQFGGGVQIGDCGTGGAACAGFGSGIGAGLGCVANTCPDYGAHAGGIGQLSVGYGGIPGLGGLSGAGGYLGGAGVPFGIGLGGGAYSGGTLGLNLGIDGSLGNRGTGLRFGYPGVADYGRGYGLSTSLLANGAIGVLNDLAGYQRPFGGGQNSWLNGFQPHGGGGIQSFPPGYMTGLNNDDRAYIDYLRTGYWTGGGGGLQQDYDRQQKTLYDSQLQALEERAKRERAAWEEREKNLKTARNLDPEIEKIRREIAETNRKLLDMTNYQRTLLTSSTAPSSFYTSPGDLVPASAGRGPTVLPQDDRSNLPSDVVPIPVGTR